MTLERGYMWNGRLSWMLLMDAGSCWCRKVRLCSCLKERKILAASSLCVAISSSLLGKMMEGLRPLMMKARCSWLLLTGGSWKWQWLMMAMWSVVLRLLLLRKSWKSVSSTVMSLSAEERLL